MKKFFGLIILLIILTGCGTKVEVPPAHVAKVLTKNGYMPETITPSKFRLSPCWAYCDKLILLEAADKGFKEEMQLFMPKDKLNIQVEVRGTLSIPTDQSTVDSIYDRVVAKEGNDYSIITLSQVYETYGGQALRGIVRSELVKYTIGEIFENRETIGANIHAAIAKKLADSHTPLKVSRFELANVQPPDVIVKAQQDAKEREIAIQRANADAQVELVKAEKDLEIARKNRLVDKEKALAIAEQNKIAADSITPQLLAYRKLEVAERIYTELANGKNSGLIIVPMDSSGFDNINNEAVLAKMLGKELKK